MHGLLALGLVLPALASAQTTAGAAAAAATAADASTADSGENPWTGTGARSFIWHNRYHGLLAMAAYGDYNTTCPQTFTAQSLQTNYPGNTNEPFQVVGTWGPTEKYQSEGFMVRVPEMNKILMVFKGQYGWENYNATLSPFLGIGCNATCKAHTGALEAWAEVKAATNDMAVIKSTQQQLVWSATGHGFGGMIMQVGALDLKSRGFLYSAQSFGSPPVFNNASVARWNDLFGEDSDASQRTVANNDSVPATIPIGDGLDEYMFVNTGIHVFGTDPTYGQQYEVCESWAEDPRCAGGNSEADHYFYYTDIGTCGAGYKESINSTFDAAALRSDQAAYSATATTALLETPNTSVLTPTSTTTSSSSTSSAITSSAAGQAAADASPTPSTSSVSSAERALALSTTGVLAVLVYIAALL